MADTSGWNNRFRELAINPNGIAHTSNTPHDQLDPSTVETQLAEATMKIIPFHSIVGFHHINLESEERTLRLLIADGVQALESNQHIVSDKPPRHKSTLLF
jgi:hypothetical protein